LTDRVTGAIILNAGEGKRLRPFTIDTPKCLLPVGNVTILESQLSNLSNSGITDVLMVLGYQSEKVINFAERKFPHLKFRYVFNSDYAKTNTLYSLGLALNEAHDGFILMNGDVFFDSEILRCLYSSGYENCLAVSVHPLGQEEVKVKLCDNLVISIGKHLEPSKAYGEFIGVAKFSRAANALLKTRIEDVLKRSDGLNCYFETAVDLMLKESCIYGVNISEFVSVEIDTKEDLMHARQIAGKS
jgi:L-glutamine-phosphate cytidylyltransferase